MAEVLLQAAVTSAESAFSQSRRAKKETVTKLQKTKQAENCMQKPK